MAIIVNNKEYPHGHMFRVAIDPEFKMLSSSATSLDRREIHFMTVAQIQHGMTIIDGKNEERVQSIYVTPAETRRQFYFMHIYKTSGLSLNREILNRFSNKQVYSNFVGLVDDKQLLSSSLITGHFASYPIDLFKNNNRPLNSFTIVRDPIDRSISHYLYESKIYDPNSEPSIDGFHSFISDNYQIMKDIQTKNITSSMNTDLSNYVYRAMLSGKYGLQDVFKSLGTTSRFLAAETNESEWRSHVDKFSLIGTVHNRSKFINSLMNMLDDEGYPGKLEAGVFINKNFSSTEKFRSILPASTINTLCELNKNDIELYESLLSRGL